MFDPYAPARESWYIELTDSAEMAHLQEWLGREYARHLGVPWPIKPDWSGPSAEPPLSVYVRYYTVAIGGVLPIDAACIQFADREALLTDGTVYVLDLFFAAVDFDGLTPVGQATVRPVMPELLPRKHWWSRR